MILGMIILTIEVPLPLVKQTAIYRSFVIRIVLLSFQAFLTLLYYQVSFRDRIMSFPKMTYLSVQGTNASLWSMIAIMCYTRAQLLGEVMEEAKANRGNGVGKA